LFNIPLIKPAGLPATRILALVCLGAIIVRMVAETKTAIIFRIFKKSATVADFSIKIS
jgi:hypothetical protein